MYKGNDDNYADMNNESRMRNDGQMYGSSFHNTEERSGLGQVPTEADVILFYKNHNKISLKNKLNLINIFFRFIQNSENKEAINIMFLLKRDHLQRINLSYAMFAKCQGILQEIVNLV